MAEITRERAQEIVKELIGVTKQLNVIAEELRWPGGVEPVEHSELMLIEQTCHAFGFAHTAAHCAFEARNFLSTAFGINCWTGEALDPPQPALPDSVIGSCPDCTPDHLCDQHIPF